MHIKPEKETYPFLFLNILLLICFRTTVLTNLKILFVQMAAAYWIHG